MSRHSITAPGSETTSLLMRLSDYYQLTKPNVTFMVVLTALAGLYLGARGPLDVILVLETLFGTALIAGGASALNMLIESEMDARMKRTNKRPLPNERIGAREALVFSISISLAGVGILTFLVNPLTGFLAAVTLISYVFLYTPLKRKTTLATLVGAVPGALPPVGGWTAVRGEITIEAVVLFAILFFWQIPHFLAIAWLYKEDYRRGGFLVLPHVDPNGGSTARQIIGNTLSLLSISLMPTLLGLTGSIYFYGALVLGMGFLYAGVRVAMLRTSKSARKLLLVSVVYLPLLLALMTWDKIPF